MQCTCKWWTGAIPWEWQGYTVGKEIVFSWTGWKVGDPHAKEKVRPLSHNKCTNWLKTD